MPAPLHVVAHNGAPEWGGAEIALTRILLGLRERGHRVTFFVAKEPVAEGARRMGMETRRLPVGGDVAIHHALRVSRALRGAEADVLLIGTFRKTLHLAVGARLAGVPVVSRIGMSSDLPRNAKYRFLFRHLVDRVAVNTGEIRADYLRALPGLDPRRVEVLGKGLDPVPRGEEDGRTRREVRDEAGIPEDAFVVGSLARLVPEKRLDRWLAAVARLPDDVWGLVVGDGPERENLEREARRLEVHDRVRFVGYRETPRPWLGAMDVLLVSSSKEALANAMLEAMAVGTPVVSTPVAGSGDALLGNEGDVAPGVILADFEVGGMVEALRRLHDDAAATHRMGDAARARIARHFSRGAEIDRWEAILRSAVSERT